MIKTMKKIKDQYKLYIFPRIKKNYRFSTIFETENSQ